MNLPDDVRTIGQYIRHLREQRRMSVDFVANELDVSVMDLRQAEDDREPPPKPASLARLLGTTVKDFKRFTR